MSNMKCPKCGGRLVYWGATGALLKCEQCKFGWGNEELWQELMRTRKALRIAVDALKELKPQKAKGGGYWAVKSADAIKLINTTIKQITAPEQKEELCSSSK